jgi:hypothetical protein
MFRITRTIPAVIPAGHPTGRAVGRRAVGHTNGRAAPETCPGPIQERERHATLLGAPGPALLEAAFRAWVEGHAKADVLVVGDRDAGHGPVPIPLEPALRVLSTSARPLAPARGEALGLPADVTVGAAAAALLQACTDPDGPRCRSYRSATYFMIGRALLDIDELLQDEEPEVGSAEVNDSWHRTTDARR